ncbi:class I SAM-dependent methyltransferase [Amaricoccus macauensis]|uniref:class I SAM-dependent methyltransferase n=1 Tax=Amaricoccus macauensis TaxID=57001 RepID=UPI003C79DE3D
MPQTDRLAFALEAGEITLPESGPVAVLRAEPSDFLRAVPADRLHCEQSDRRLFDRLDAAGLPVEPQLEVSGAALAVVNLTRSKAESRGNAARALRMLAPGGLLLLNGNKTDGIDSISREIGRSIPASGSCSKAHGKVVSFPRPDELPDVVATWAAEIEVSQTPEGDWTRPGMFSPDGSDPGSQLLAEQFGTSLRGRVADLGAGWGYLSRACLAASPAIAQLDLFEAEMLALDAARRNVTDPRAEFHWTDVASLRKTTAPYDTVIANPPFHLGRAADPEVGAAFIAAAARILKPSGQFLMVANRHLPYEARLDAAFRHRDQIAESRDFKVLRATSPRRP